MSTIVEDNFSRADVNSSWGTASDGHPWTTETSAGTIAMTSKAGLVTGSNQTGANLLLGSYSRTDAEVLVKFSLSDANAACHPILRFVSHGNFYYAGQDLGGNLAIKKRVGDVGTALVTTAHVVSPNTAYWLRFNITGTTLSLRFWQNGTAEPGTWNLTTTDTTYAAGAIGQRCTCNGVGDTVSVSSFQVSDLTTTAPNVLVADTFTRSNQSGWGNASDSEPWVAKDANATYSILSNQGKATSFAASSSNSVLGGTAIYESDMKVRFSVSVPASDALFFIARWTSASNFYFIGYVQTVLSARKVVSGSSSTIVSTAFTPTASTLYWLRSLVQGTNLKLKCWQDGTSEPSSWTLQTTDSSLTQGNPGLRLFGGASDVVLVDSLTVNVPAPGKVLLGDGGYGGVFQ